MADTAEATSPLTEFEYFPKLAPELRLKIWEFAFDLKPRIVECRLGCADICADADDIPCMRVNREAREVGAKKYRIPFEKQVVNPVYFDFSRDILLFDDALTCVAFTGPYSFEERVDPIRIIGVKCSSSSIGQELKTGYFAEKYLGMSLEEFFMVSKGNPVQIAAKAKFQQERIFSTGPKGWNIHEVEVIEPDDDPRNREIAKRYGVRLIPGYTLITEDEF